MNVIGVYTKAGYKRIYQPTRYLCSGYRFASLLRQTTDEVCALSDRNNILSVLIRHFEVKVLLG